MLVANGFAKFQVSIIGNNKNAYSNKLLKLIDEKKLTPFFIWKGFITEPSEIYNNIDVVVVPTMSTTDKYCVESFSLTTAEAMIRGLVVVASDKGGMKELIHDSESGLLFEEGDASAEYRSLSRLILDQKLITLLGGNAQKRALNNFTTEIMINKYIGLYNTCLQRSHE
jgi:glycosyltransferase involved in cell wall biosynthesis